MDEDEDRLRGDVAFALRDVPIPRTKRERSEDWRNIVADRVVRYLKLANWRFHPGAPAPPSTTPPVKSGMELD